MKTDPVHRSLVTIDIEEYSRRTNPEQLDLRADLRRVLNEAQESADVSTDQQQDGGDAALLLVPPDVPKPRLVDGFVRELENALRRRNRGYTDQARMRLRVALHAGEVHLDGTGFPGAGVVTVKRLIEVEALRRALKTAPRDIAVIVSQHLYEQVVLHGYDGIRPEQYEQTAVMVKECRTTAWIRVPGDMPHGEPGDATDPGPNPEPPYPGDTNDLGRKGTQQARSPSIDLRDSLNEGQFHGPVSFGGHAAGRDVNVRGQGRGDHG